MAFSVKEWVVGGKKFCCCLPVRFGVLVMSFLSILVSLTLAIVVWFEVATSNGMSGSYKAAFLICGVVESILCVASILGFTGAVVRKQLFVMIYAYFLYFHFLLNLAVASYFLWMITHAANKDIQVACQKAQDAGTKMQCSSLLNIAKGVFVGVASFVLLVELYGAIIVTRYWRKLRNEKRTARQSRMQTDSAFSMRPAHARFTSDTQGLLAHAAQPSTATDEFNPYTDYSYRPAGAAVHARDMSAANDLEEGYGGGRWTHEEIAESEKRRLQDEEARAVREAEMQTHPDALFSPASLAESSASMSPRPRRVSSGIEPIPSGALPPVAATSPHVDSPPAYDPREHSGPVGDRKVSS